MKYDTEILIHHKFSRCTQEALCGTKGERWNKRKIIIRNKSVEIKSTKPVDEVHERGNKNRNKNKMAQECDTMKRVGMQPGSY